MPQRSSAHRPQMRQIGCQHIIIDLSELGQGGAFPFGCQQLCADKGSIFNLRKRSGLGFL